MPTLLLLTLILLPGLTVAQEQLPPPPLPPVLTKSAEPLPDLDLGEPNPVLSPLELKALAIGNQWREPKAALGADPSPGANGTIQFVFGASQPTIVCAVLHVCDIALQAGERISGVNMGDTARWLLEPAVTGQGSTETQHLIVKPLAVNLNTNVVVTTDRRAYNLRLRSHRSEYMAQVTFVYPDSALEKWNHRQQLSQETREKQTIPETGEYLGNLNFAYTVSGEAPWKPVRVYNDGVKTIIQMPDSLPQNEAPSLLALREQRGLFANDDAVLINYRLQSNRYIVDGLPDKLILVAGVGQDQDKITIERVQ
jgi:type IV secretion system protein TrbG